MKSRKLHVEIQGYRNLKEYLVSRWPELDDETLADTLEGITSLHEMIAEIVCSALEDQGADRADPR